MIDKTVSRVLAVQGMHALSCRPNFLSADFDLGVYVDDLLAVASTEEDIVWHEKSNSKFLYRLLKCCIENLSDVDGHIERFMSQYWKINRMADVCLAIVRIGISEVISCPNSSLRIVISEYINISDMFLDKDEVGFVHAILDKVGNALRVQPDQVLVKSY